MWHVRLSLRAISEDMLFDALDTLDPLSPVATLGPDEHTLSLIHI